MAIKTKEELLASFKERIGEDTSDEALTLIEDVTDTLNDMDKRANGDGTDWKKKYEENDATWRNKYKERFFSGSSKEEDEDLDDEPKKLTFESLFKEE